MLQDAYAEYNNLQPGPRYPDTLQNLNLISVIQSPFNGTTRIRFSRQFNTPDFKQDVSIPYVSFDHSKCSFIHLNRFIETEHETNRRLVLRRFGSSVQRRSRSGPGSDGHPSTYLLNFCIPTLPHRSMSSTFKYTNF